ncbi:hypothetical protein [Flavobacterium sp. MMS24-S5]|uniref:hypothetical protein n=1 Tax=Flavobacterium sp. MMS24-S5 TaxID=3416605 RepID=UPI003D01CA91
MKILDKYRKIEDEEFINSLTEESLSNLIDELCEYWFENNKKKGESKFSFRVWYSFEYDIWRLGENLRNIIKKKNFKKSARVEKAIIEVLMNNRYGKGRETFALLVGEFKFHLSEKQVQTLLEDKEVYGHLIVSLRKLRMKGFDEKMKIIINSEKGWIKTEAKKYLDKSASW